MYSYCSLDRIFDTLTREKVPFTEEDALSYTAEALEGIGTTRMLEEAVAFYEVRNHQCVVPQYCLHINQVAKHNNWTTVTKPFDCTPKAIADAAPNIFYQNCAECNGVPQGVDMGYIVLDCKGMPLVEYDLAYYRPYSDLLGEFFGWSTCGYYRNTYSPLRLTNNVFFNSIVAKEHDGSLYSNCVGEYTVINGTVLRFSFDCGFVAISYKRTVLDKVTGFPMIPDHFSHIRAIVSYIKFRNADVAFMERREGSAGVRATYEAEWQWYCGQASNYDKMPQGIDEYQNLLDQRNYLLPDNSRYYRFFGNLNKPEYRKYNDPDFRNNHFTTRHG